METQEISGSDKNTLVYRQKVDNENDNPNHPWYLLSLISWIIFICCLWSYYILTYSLWAVFESQIAISSYETVYFPIKLEDSWLKLYICLISLISFIVYLVFTTCKKKQNLYDGMLGTFSKFHFIPLLLISAWFITISTAKDRYSTYNRDVEELQYNKMLLIFDIIFTLLALISLIIIYIKTELNCEWYIVMAIKKGFFSTLIVLLWYNLFHTIVCLRSIDILLSYNYEKDNLYSCLKVTGIIFSCLIGIGSFVFSFLFNDVAAAFTNFLIYLGFVLFFFPIYNEEKSRTILKEDFNGVADGVIDIVMMCLSVVLIVIALFRHNQILV